MPPAVGFLVGLGLSVGTATVVVEIAATIVINILLTKIQNLLAPNPNANSTGPPPVNLTLQTTVEYRRIIFGTARVGGVFVFYRTSGTTNEVLWYVVAYAGHQCSAAHDAYLDARQVPSADINGSTGAVSTTAFNSKLSIWTHLGTGSQTTDTQLNAAFGGTFDSNHKLQGITYRVFKMTRDDTAWPGGAPQSITSVIDGALLYDPRLDSDNGGSGSHRASDPSTWAFSHNAALAVRWFLSGGSVVNDQSSRIIKYGLKETDARIDDSYTRAAATHCDESISGANAPPGGAEARYRCDIEVTCGQTRREILTELLSTMGPGQLAYVHGTWRLYAAVFDTPAHDFNQDDLYGEMEIQDTSSAADRFNATCASYTDASQGYVPATTIFRTNSAYETQDGGERIEKTIAVRGTSSPYQAQRIAELVNRSSRYMRTVKFRFRRSGMKVANWETFTFSHKRYGWSNRVFRCLERGLEPQDDGGILCVITAKQDDSAVYSDLVTADYITGTSVTSAIQSEVPEAPTALTATVIGGQNIRFDWTLPAFWQLNGISELWEFTSSTPFSSATKVWQGSGTTAILTRNDTTTRFYWVRVRTKGGQAGDHFPATTGVSGAAAQIATGNVANAAISQTVTGDSGGIQWGPSNSVTSPTSATGVTVTITTTGGVVGIDAQTGYWADGRPGNPTDAKMQILRDGSALPSGTGIFDDASGTNMVQFAPITLSAIDTPSAGSHTYTLVATIAGPSGPLVGATLTAPPSFMKVREYKK